MISSTRSPSRRSDPISPLAIARGSRSRTTTLPCPPACHPLRRQRCCMQHTARPVHALLYCSRGCGVGVSCHESLPVLSVLQRSLLKGLLCFLQKKKKICCVFFKKRKVGCCAPKFPTSLSLSKSAQQAASNWILIVPYSVGHIYRRSDGFLAVHFEWLPLLYLTSLSQPFPWSTAAACRSRSVDHDHRTKAQRKRPQRHTHTRRRREKRGAAEQGPAAKSEHASPDPVLTAPTATRSMPNTS